MLVALIIAGAACWILAAKGGKAPPLEDRRAWRWVGIESPKTPGELPDLLAAPAAKGAFAP